MTKSILYLYIDNPAIINHDNCDKKIFINSVLPEVAREEDQFFNYFSVIYWQELLEFDNRVPRYIVDKMQKFFYAYTDQYYRWSFTRKIHIDKLYSQFNDEISRWYWFVNTNNIKLIYFYEDPHHAFDIILYNVAILLNIEVKIFSVINIGYRSYIKNIIEDDLSSAVSVDIRTNTIENISVNIQHTGVIKDAIVSKYNWNRIKDIITRKFSNVLTKINLYKRNTTIVPIFRSFILIYIQNRIFFLKAFVERCIYIRYHNKIVKQKVDVCKKDIVFYKHFFPERTSNPLSSPYFSQEECLSILNHTKNRLLLKEHPISLGTRNSHRVRCAQKISHLQRYVNDNITVVSSVSESEHIVATMNGTVGLEMAMKGYKVICFGNPWYGFLINVHVYEDYNALVEFINKEVVFSIAEIKQKIIKEINSKTADFRVCNKYDKSQNINKSVCEEYLIAYGKGHV